MVISSQAKMKRYSKSIKAGDGEGNDSSLQYSCLENPTDRGAWRAIVDRVAESDTTEMTQHSMDHPRAKK